MLFKHKAKENEGHYFTVEMESDLEGCRPDEVEWAFSALRKVYNCAADIANNGLIDMYNALWDLKHPNHGKMEGALLQEYDDGYEAFMQPVLLQAAVLHGVSKDRKRIVRLTSMIRGVVFDSDLKHGVYHGIVEDFNAEEFLQKLLE